MKKNSFVLLILMCAFFKDNCSFPPAVTTLATLGGVSSLSASIYCIIQASEQQELLTLAGANEQQIRDQVGVWRMRSIYTGIAGCVLLLPSLHNARCKSAATHLFMIGSVMYGMGADYAVKAKLNHRQFILTGDPKCKEKRNKCIGGAALMAVLGTLCVGKGMAC